MSETHNEVMEGANAVEEAQHGEEGEERPHENHRVVGARARRAKPRACGLIEQHAHVKQVNARRPPVVALAVAHTRVSAFTCEHARAP